MFRTGRQLSLAFFLAQGVLSGTVVAAEGLIDQWQFDSGHVHGNSFKALAGSLDATVVGPVRFASEPPQALRLDGDSKSKHRISVTDDLGQIALPERDITVEAWVKVDEPLEWGGIVGVIQDNGSYEKGWLLGYRKSMLCFGVASEKAGKLTYLECNCSSEKLN